MNSLSSNSIRRLRGAFARRNLTLYLGAGVSAGSNLPDWRKLVVSMYFRALQEHDMGRDFRPLPNYLYALAEWHVQRQQEMPEITAQKIRNLHLNADDFLQSLRHTLYGPFLNPETDRLEPPLPAQTAKGKRHSGRRRLFMRILPRPSVRASECRGELQLR